MPLLGAQARVINKNAPRLINWFPGHMTKGIKKVMAKLQTVDCVIEVHDARIPFSGRNNIFREQLAAIKPSVLVLNKCDLADLSDWNLYKNKLSTQNYKEIFLTNLSGNDYDTNMAGYTDIVQKVIDVIRESERYNRVNSDAYRAMIVGIPNVGKSTLINRLRQYHTGKGGQPAQVGALPGATLAVSQTIRICNSPKIYLIDSPGILHPSSLKNDEEGLKMALCSSISDKVIPVARLAKFLLTFLNNNNLNNYVHTFGLKHPTDDLKELISYGAFEFNMFIKVKKSSNQEHMLLPDADQICWKFIKCFRKGLFGKAMLDSIDNSSFI